jgi:TIR domain
VRLKQWFDGKIGAGVELDESINANLAGSDIILLLISAAFLNSDYCWDKEMVRAMRRHQKGDARVIPIIIRPVDDSWQETIFGKLKALPTDGKPVAKWSNRDSAWKDVAKGIRDAVKDLGGSRSVPRRRKNARRGDK